MSYVDLDYYTDEYMGAEITDTSEFERMEKRASEVVDQLTHYRIKDLESLAEPIRERVKKAVCAQIEFYTLSGGYEATVEQGDMQSVSIGGFSYTQGSARETANFVAQNVVGHLKQTGLLYSGVSVRGC